MRTESLRCLLGRKVVLITLVLVLSLLVAACGPDGIIGFQGRLVDASGNPIDGSLDITFRLFTASSGGTAIYTDSHTGVTVTNGLLNVGIGSGSGGELDPKDFAQPLWLEIVIGGETLSPRQKLLGAPYAMTLVGGAVIGSTSIDNSDPNYGVLNVINGSSGTGLTVAVVAGEAGAADLIRGCDTDDGQTCADVEFRVSGDGEVFADQGYNCGVNINDSNASGDLSETELDPCLRDNSPAADFAEMLPSVAGLGAGDVLVIGSEGLLARSSGPYQTNVVGVYSTKPSYVGNASKLGMNGYAPLAVAGIVPVKVTAENGVVRPGDLLTTSSLPGHAMKAGPNPPAGSVVGKALGSLASGTGVIPMLVMLK